MTKLSDPGEILDFWFSAEVRERWFDATAAFDRDLRREYEDAWRRARRGELDHWRRSADGCLALPNEEILKLTSSLKPLVTPVIVARQMDWAPLERLDELRLEFRLALDMWRESLERGDVLDHLSLYARDFRYRDMDRGEWSNWRRKVFAARTLTSVGCTGAAARAAAGKSSPRIPADIRFQRMLSRSMSSSRSSSSRG